MKVYIPESMIKKTKSMARHNDDIKLDEEVSKLVALDMISTEAELGNPMIDAIKSTAVTVAAIAVVYWGFYA